MGKQTSDFVDLILGALPSERIGRALDLELDEGQVELSRIAQRHVSVDHPEDYAICLPHIAAIIANPLYVGDDFKNPGRLEVVGRIIAVGGPVLIGLTCNKDKDGFYRVVTFYRISEKKVENRRANSRLVIVPF